MKYPLTFSTWDKKENLAIKSVVKSGYFSMGKKVEEFERKFAKYFLSFSEDKKVLAPMKHKNNGIQFAKPINEADGVHSICLFWISISIFG